MPTSQLHIGCSGYYYPSWKGGFYPKDIKPSGWLEFYSAQFNTVELNGTFYRLPKATDLKKYYNQTPRDFRFSVKMSRYVTHIKRLSNCADEIARFNALMEEGLQEKLGCILYQMPPSFHYTDENLQAIISSVPNNKYHTVELRHDSWWNEVVFGALAKAGITLCNVDFPGLKTPIVNTGDLFYLRMHGNPILFKSSYSKETLGRLKHSIPTRAKEVYVYFNNTYFDGGYTNAVQLRTILYGMKLEGD